MCSRSRFAPFLLLAVALAVSCSGTGGAPAPPPTVTVVVSPGAAHVEVFTSQQFTATVTGSTNTAVTWQVNGVAGGRTSTGTISSSGLYHAPHSVPVGIVLGGNSETITVTVTAVSQANPMDSNSATVTVFAPNENRQSAPVALGTTGGNTNDSSTSGNTTTCCGGTLGSLVIRAGTQYILSNNHLLARSDQALPGESIIQPALTDAPITCLPAGTTTVGTLSQFFNLETGVGTKVDAAIAQAVPGNVDPSGAILLLGTTTDANGIPVAGAPRAGTGIAPLVGAPVAKSGRSTGLTCSVIESITATTSVSYQKGCGTGATFNVTYTNQAVVLGGAFSAGGDSGSLIVTQDTADPVALLFAGSDVDTIGNPVADVLSAFPDGSGNTPSFVGGAAHAVAGCSLPGPQAATATMLAVQEITPSTGAIVRAARVRDLHTPELLAHPGVQALGVGASLDEPGTPAILFFVGKGQPRRDISAQVEGIRTRIIEGDLFAKRGAVSADESAVLEQSVPLPPSVSCLGDAEVARARAIHAAHVDALMKEPGVQGVGISSSADSPGEAALMIYLIRGVPHGDIPAVIDGLRTRIKESSRFTAGYDGTVPPRACVRSAALAKSAGPGRDHKLP